MSRNSAELVAQADSQADSLADNLPLEFLHFFGSRIDLVARAGIHADVLAGFQPAYRRLSACAGLEPRELLSPRSKLWTSMAAAALWPHP
jgi:hypothetical protein